jgi:septal ring factor EnvC (AmiA/AmiB activator)
MEIRYTINQISSACKVSKQSLYKFINKNKTFINENSTRNHRIIYYNQAAMDFFLAYYQPDRKTDSEEIPVSDIEKNTAEKRAEKQAEKAPIEAPQTEQPPEGQLNALERKIAALEAEIETLRKQLDASETEKKELLRQNGEVLLLLQMEKQEKQLFLPAPKKSFSERVKSLFHK